MDKRVKYIGKEKPLQGEFAGMEGTLIGPGRNCMYPAGSTDEERAKIDQDFALENSFIHWDGKTWPWNCPNCDFISIEGD